VLSVSVTAVRVGWAIPDGNQENLRFGGFPFPFLFGEHLTVSISLRKGDRDSFVYASCIYILSRHIPIPISVIRPYFGSLYKVIRRRTGVWSFVSRCYRRTSQKNFVGEEEDQKVLPDGTTYMRRGTKKPPSNDLSRGYLLYSIDTRQGIYPLRS